MIARRMGPALAPMVLAGLVACGAPGEEPAGDGDAAPPAAPVAPGTSTAEPRPGERLIPVEIEGFEEELRFVLYRSPEDFPLPFSTYIPEAMEAEMGRRNDAHEVAFVAAFSGARNESAALRVHVHGPAATESDAAALLAELAAELGTELVAAPQEEGFDWAIRQFRNVAVPFRADAAEGVMALGRRGDRFFSIAIHYPAEYGDGLGPRVHQILQEWRWEDTGERLMVPERALNGQAAGGAALRVDTTS
jgi:hypothetical protein